jgi:hypothetical protein
MHAIRFGKILSRKHTFEERRALPLIGPRQMISLLRCVAGWESAFAFENLRAVPLLVRSDPLNDGGYGG